MTASDTPETDAARFRKGKAFCETIATLSDAEICYRVGEVIDDRDRLAALLERVVQAFPDLADYEGGDGESLAPLAGEIQAALGRGGNS